LNVIEQRYGKSIDKEIAMGAQNGLTSIPSTALQVDTLKVKVIKS
jgi:hypothetical protein